MWYLSENERPRVSSKRLAFASYSYDRARWTMLLTFGLRFVSRRPPREGAGGATKGGNPET